MKKYIMFFIISLMVFQVQAQEEANVDNKTAKKLSKKQRLEQKRVDEEATAKLVDWMVEQRRFVLEADYLSNKIGERINVNNTLNFLLIDSSKITIQLASNSGIGGPNGMGGITTDGMITSYEVKKIGKARNNYSLRVLTITGVGSYDIFFNISPNGLADATIGGSWSGKLNYHGRLVPINKSRVFKGPAI
jgi:hypothetical protein